MKALIAGDRVAQIVPDGEQFPIAAPFVWVDAPGDVTERHIYDNGQFVAPPGPEPKTRDELKATIDLAAGAARLRFVSPGDLVDQEYREAEAAARGWQDAGEPGDAVPDEVQAWADASGMTPRAAAQDVIDTGAQWRQVLAQVRALRLQGKADVQNAGSDAEAAAAADNTLAALDSLRPA
ncbi:hypothetical protein [Alkalilimnicola sp. S0819]|uniref:hypothetical protein n=1 Tax=Alkalilimnicola sp. S0819 TaxID=2613922 RepID=UPI0012628426|nr:hypothetical protein [Alkalilimnicola sp. S0819]KAB7624310.1 hypothetical protein F3N43_05740 [Alkalilimnicola sp. S0819]MPQ16134.1 hypothetical protein [Alkalilimnicola sp. S0819]